MYQYRRDPCQSAVVTTRHGRFFWVFPSRVSKHLIYFIAVSAIAIFRLIDNVRLRLSLASLGLFTDLITMSACLQYRTTTPGLGLARVSRDVCSSLISLCEIYCMYVCMYNLYFRLRNTEQHSHTVLGSIDSLY